MKKPLLIALVAIGSLTILASTNVLTSILTKKKCLPKEIDGDLYIDYTEDSNHPALYLQQVSPDIFKDNPSYVVIRVTHIRK